MIQTHELTKSFAGRQVLRGMSLQVEPGEVFGFVGPNGAGKTTFIKCLLGITSPDGGTATIDGIDVVADPLAGRRRLGYAPGEIALYNRMKVRELVAFAIAFHKHADGAAALAMLDDLGVPHERKIGKLSHGMKRKVLLAQALAVDVPLLLLDEPMEGLDPSARRYFEQQLSAKAADGRTVFFSSHDLDSVERICDRVAFVRDGVILEVGPVDALLARAGRMLSVTLHEPRSAADLPQSAGYQWSGAGTRWKLEFEGELSAALRLVADLPVAGVRDATGGLGELFEALYGAADSAEAV